MLKLAPLFLAILVAVLNYHLAARRSARMLAEKSRPLDDAGLARITARMARALDLSAIRVHVYEVDPVNGLAAPDGRIYLTRGFLNRRDAGEVSDEELASVIAHELGHVALGHTRRRMIDFTGQNAAFMVLTAILGRFVPFVGPWLARLASSALMAGLSRKDEFEADAWAAALLIKSGIGTAPQISLFRKLGALTGSGTAPGAATAWLMSHPATERRIAAIAAAEARWTA